MNFTTFQVTLKHVLGIANYSGKLFYHYLPDANDEMIQLLVAADYEGELLRTCLMQRDSQGRTLLHNISIRGEWKMLQAVLKCVKYLNSSEEDSWGLKTYEKILCATDAAHKTAFHYACQYNRDSIIRDLIEMAAIGNCVARMITIIDKKKRSFLFYLSRASSEIIHYLIDTVTAIDSNSFQAKGKDCLTHQLLTQRDIYKRTSLEYEPQSQKADFCGFLTPFFEQVKKLSHRAASRDRISKTVSSECDRKTDWNDALNDEDSVTCNSEASDSVANSSDGEDEDDEEEGQEKLKVILSHSKAEYFHLFEVSSDAESYSSRRANSLLTTIADSDCLELIKHEYTQCYLSLCWRSYTRGFFLCNLFIYLMLLIWLTSLVTGHNFDFPIVNGTVQTDSVIMYSSNSTITLVSQCLLIVFSLLTLGNELLQMAAKRSEYWKTLDNYADMYVCITSLVLSISSLVTGYKMWHHQLGTVTMTITWINGAWMMTKIPSVNKPWLQEASISSNHNRKWLEEVSLSFSMLFRVIRNVCLFLPVLAIFILAFALAFQSLFQNQIVFGNIGHAVIKTLAMTIGELEYGDVLFSDPDADLHPFHVLGCLLFVVFTCIMTISAMNLLVGTAVGDIKELRDRSEVLAYSKLVDLILESQAHLQLFQRAIECICRKDHSNETWQTHNICKKN